MNNHITPVMQNAISGFMPDEQQPRLWVVPFQDGPVGVDVTILAHNRAHAVLRAKRFLNGVYVEGLRIGKVEVYRGKTDEPDE